jgi:hypothetical protein
VKHFFFNNINHLPRPFPGVFSLFSPENRSIGEFHPQNPKSPTISIVSRSAIFPVFMVFSPVFISELSNSQCAAAFPLLGGALGIRQFWFSFLFPAGINSFPVSPPAHLKFLQPAKPVP